MIHALISGVITFFIALALGGPILRYLRHQKMGKAISEYQPETHQKKAGTPVFGGLMIWLPTFLVTAVAVDWWNHNSILLPLGVIAASGITGFVDDMGTLQGRRQTGLSWRFKVGFVTALACVAAWVLYDQVEVQSIHIPWTGSYELGLIYLAIAVITIVATRLRAGRRSSPSSPTGSLPSSRGRSSWRPSPSSSPGQTLASSGTTPTLPWCSWATPGRSRWVRASLLLLS
jgi:phospho-N-acetylmuramoyl-pentapeptide-transferase